MLKEELIVPPFPDFRPYFDNAVAELTRQEDEWIMSLCHAFNLTPAQLAEKYYLDEYPMEPTTRMDDTGNMIVTLHRKVRLRRKQDVDV